MFSERTAGCGVRCPRPVAYQPPRKGVGVTHARRHPWIVPLSYVAVWRAPHAPVRPPKPLRACDASTTRPGPATTCATGSQATRLRRLPSGASWPISWSRAVTMSPPRNERSGPRAAEPVSRHQNIATATAKRQRPSPVAMVRQGRRTHRYPVASASLYEPSCERTWWWISLRCPWCMSVHLHRVRHEEDAAGVRRTGCGRRVFVKIRTVYRGNAGSGVAA
jgi:hypothetical protein